MHILVLCTGNSCRSQMAEKILQSKLGESHKVFSAGSKPQAVNQYAIQVMQEIGLDISQNSSNHLDEYKNIQFDFIITVCSNADKNCPNFTGAVTKLHFPFEDPANAIGSEEEILVEFRKVRDQIKQKLTDWLNSL